MTLADHGILARTIDAVRVNDCRLTTRAGRPAWVKRRRRWGDAAILGGNVFLAASNSRIRMFPGVDRWRRWELGGFRLLNGDAHACGFDSARGVWFDAIPGRSLRALDLAGALGEPALRAAGREFARAHSLRCPLRRAPWSHGDPHLGNVLFDDAAGRARLIDFETEHERHLSPSDRRADDALTFLLELMVRSTTDDDWRRRAGAFLDGYAIAGDTARALRRRLRVPTGLERVLWQTRTEYLHRHVVTQRLAQVRTLLYGSSHLKTLTERVNAKTP